MDTSLKLKSENWKMKIGNLSARGWGSSFLWGVILVLGSLIWSGCESAGKHFFILSGQSNMVGMDPAISFLPAVEAAFGAEHVVVVKDAKGGEPIRRWYKDWAPANGDEPVADGALYGQLMEKVEPAMEGQSFQSVTFVWMQGERDARESHGEVYAAALDGLYNQLKNDLRLNEVNVVIGRLSDFDMDNARYPHWTMVREAQVAFADGCDTCKWVDTDDLNDGENKAGKQINNDLHYAVEGYKILGERFAQAAIQLINGS